MKLKNQYPIVVMLIIIFLVCSSFESASSIYIKSNINLSNFNYLTEAELPEWSFNEYWLYDLEFDFTLNDSFFIVGLIEDMEMIVTEIDAGNDIYTVSIGGFLNTSLEIFNFKNGNFYGFVTGEAHFEKSTLAIKDFNLKVEGDFNNSNTKANFVLTFDPAFDFFSFPIKTTDPPWYADTMVSLSGNFQVGPANIPFNVQGSFEDEKIVYNKIESITVPAGTFQSFKLSGSIGTTSELWYSNNVGYLVKIHEVIDEWTGIVTNIDLALKATTFNTNNNRPFKPSKPNGTLSGYVDRTYKYNTSAFDIDGDKLFYRFYWGDGTFSDWVGPYPSGSEGNASHKWEKKGNYEIIVKAKDEHGVHSEWSNPLSVTMPRNRAINISFFKFLQNFLNLFPILRQILRL